MAEIIITGYNPDVDIATDPETAWENSGLYTFPTSAETLGIVSDDANDTSAGTGLRKLLIKGLDSNFEEIEEEITLNGITEVTSTKSFLRVNEVKGLTAGATEENEGNITIDNTTSGNILSYMPALLGKSRVGVYTVPDNRELKIERISATATLVGSSAEIRIRTKEQTNNCIVTLDSFRLQDRVAIDYGRFGISVGQKTDLEILIHTVGSDDFGAYVTLQCNLI